jgi:large subunit ribosomal protein L1
MSFDAQKLQENIQAFIDFIQNLKPATIKGTYVKGISISATMSPGVTVAA